MPGEQLTLGSLVPQARELLAAAAPYREYGEHYDRAVADSAFWLADGLDREFSEESVGVRMRELQARLAVAAPLS